MGISSTEKKCITTCEKLQFFMCAWDSQSADGTSLALFSASNECHHILFFKCETS